MPETLLYPDAGKWLVGFLMAVDRLAVATGLLVLLGGAGFLAVARLPEPAWRLIRRLEWRIWRLLRVAWWATFLGTLAGLLLYGPFTADLPLSRAVDAALLAQTLGTPFGVVWAVRVGLLLLVVCLPAWSKPEAAPARTSAWVAVGLLAAALAVTPTLSGHAGSGPDAAMGVAVGVVHFAAAAIWFGGLVLLGTCVLPRAQVALLPAVPRFSSVAFTAMVVIVVTGIMQGWRQLGGLHALGHTAYGRLLVAKVAVFLLLIAVAARSRVLVRRRLTARALADAMAPHHPAGSAAPAGPDDDADARTLWLLRRSVLAEVSIAIGVLAVTALLGIAMPPTAV